MTPEQIKEYCQEISVYPIKNLEGEEIGEIQVVSGSMDTRREKLFIALADIALKTALKPTL